MRVAEDRERPGIAESRRVLVDRLDVGDEVAAGDAVARGRLLAVELTVQRIARDVLNARREQSTLGTSDDLEEARPSDSRRC